MTNEGGPKDTGKMFVRVDKGGRPHVGVVPGTGGVDGERFLRQLNAADDKLMGYAPTGKPQERKARRSPRRAPQE